MQYKGDRKPSLPKIAADLNVEAIVEGTVLLTGQQVIVTARVV